MGRAFQGGLQPYQATLGSLDAGRNYNWLATDTLKQMYFDPAKRGAVFHYVCFADSLSGLGSTSGISRGIPAHDFLVTLGGWRTFGGTSLQKAGTFMHELGHNLGLQHGGGDGVKFKPNFLSVMNYSFQTLGLLRPSGIATVRDFDYSRSQLAALTETRLLESAGIGDAEGQLTLWNINQTNGACLEHPDDYYRLLAYPATDWSCDGALSPGTVSVDLNEDVTKSQLEGFDDWSALRFDGGGEIGRLVASSDQRKLLPLSDVIATPANEPTYEDIRDFVPPSLFDAEASAPIDVVTQTVATGSGPLSVNFDGGASTTPGPGQSQPGPGISAMGLLGRIPLSPMPMPLQGPTLSPCASRIVVELKISFRCVTASPSLLLLSHPRLPTPPRVCQWARMITC